MALDVFSGGTNIATVLSHEGFHSATVDKGAECILFGGWFCLLDSYSAIDTQGTETDEVVEFQTVGASSMAVGEPENGRCIFIGNPCRQDPDPVSIGLSTSVHTNQELRTY